MEQRYTLKEVLKALGISRTTLLYYEKQGIVTAHRDSSNGYRYFYHNDVNILKQCIWLKNLGYSIQEIAELQKSGHLFTLERIQTYRQKLMQQLQYDTAIHEQLERFENSLSRKPGQFELVMLPVYCALFVGCEEGYHHLDQNEDANTLIRHMPLSGFILRFDGDLLAGDIHFAIGRCIQETYIPLIFPDGKERNWERFGGGPALRTKIHLFDGISVYQEIEGLKAFMEKEGYIPTGRAMGLVYVFGEEVEILIPVERSTGPRSNRPEPM